MHTTYAMHLESSVFLPAVFLVIVFWIPLHAPKQTQPSVRKLGLQTHTFNPDMTQTLRLPRVYVTLHIRSVTCENSTPPLLVQTTASCNWHGLRDGLKGAADGGRGGRFVLEVCPMSLCFFFGDEWSLTAVDAHGRNRNDIINWKIF